MVYLFVYLGLAIAVQSLPQDRTTVSSVFKCEADASKTDSEILEFLSTIPASETNVGGDSSVRRRCLPKPVCPQKKVQCPRRPQPRGINFHNLDDDEYIDSQTRGFDEDSNKPIIPFKPDDFVYPNNIETTTTGRPQTTAKPATSTTNNIGTTTTSRPHTTAEPSTTSTTTGVSFDEQGVFLFHEEDFDEPPVYLTSEPVQPETTVTPGDDDDDDDDNISIEPITEGPEWPEDHPCRYSSLQHKIEVKRAGRRVSDIQCEYNMWHYKYRIVEAERKMLECNEIMKALNEPKVGVIGGKKAAQGDFPHMGAVGWRTLGNDYLFMCGSSLISSRFAISVAHCSAIDETQKIDKGLAGLRPEVVRFGNVYIQDADDPNSKLNFADVGIDGPFIILKKYTFAMKYNDIALIRLLEEVKIEYNIRPACIWGGHLGSQTVANVTGWGQTNQRAGSESAHLLYAELDFVDREVCSARTEGRTPRQEWRGLVDHQFCAGKLQGKVDTCQGDSGGPIQIQRPLPSSIDNSGIMYHVVGLTSFGIRCAQPNLPGIYVNVSDHNILCWIEKNVWPEETNEHCTGDLFEGYDPPSM